MARIRTIKPEFWSNEDLSALPEATHILAGALLNYADDYGYFNANPGLVKAACSPLREPSVSIPESLARLSEVGYLEFGTTRDGKRYGRIVKFSDHQRVDHPSKSKIADLPITWETAREGLANPREELAPEQGTGNREEQIQGVSPDGETRTTSDPIPYQRIADLFNDTLVDLPKVRLLTPKRRTLIRSAWNIGAETRALDFWRCYFEECADDKFLNGTGPYGREHANWRPDFDYLIRPATVTKTYEKALHRLERASA